MMHAGSILTGREGCRCGVARLDRDLAQVCGAAMFELTLPDMTCGHCVANVQRTVQALDPQARVDVDLSAHRVKVDTSASEEQVRLALEEEGYPAAT
jgi:copper chaperone CopZ